MSDQLPSQSGTSSIETIASNGQSAPLSEPLPAEGTTQTQNALREREQLQQLCDSMPQFVWMSNAQGELQYVNRQWVEYSGLTVEQSQNPKNIAASYHPDDAKTAFNQWATALTTKQPYEFEGRLRAANGSYRWFLIRIVPVLDDQGQVGCWYGTSTDIHDRKEAADRLQESEERFQRLVANVPGAIYQYVTHPDGSDGLIYISPQCRAIYEYEPEALQQDFSLAWQMVHPDDVERVKAAIAASAERLELLNVEFRLLPPSGKLRWVQTSSLPTRLPNSDMVWDGIITDITDRKQTEALLQESQTRLQQQLAEIEALYQSAPIGLNVLDTDLRFVRVNQRLAEMNGLTVEAHLGRTIRELLPELADSAEQLLRPILETGEPLLNVEIWGETPAQPGVQRVWLEHFLPLKDNDRIVGISTVCEEITERRRSEFALREAYIQLEAALAAGSIYTWRWSLVTNLLKVDHNFAHLFGLDPEAAATGLPIEEFLNAIHPDDRPHVVAAIDQAIASGEHYVAEYRVRNAEGQERWVIARGRVEYDSQGNAISFPGAITDITDRKRSEQALRENEQRFVTLAQASPVVIFQFNAANECIYINSRWTELTGYPEATALGMGWVDTFHPDDHDRMVREWLDWQQSAHQQDIYQNEGRLVRLDGSTLWYYIQALPLMEAGSVTGYMGVFTDITDRKQAELEREQLLAREQLARQEADRVNRLKDEFFSALSHELRTPLNPILGWTKMLQGQKLPPEKLIQALETIERNVKHQIRLVDDLLDVSRVIQGKFRLSSHPVDLSLILTDAIQTVHFAAQAKSITLQFESSIPIYTTGDRDRLGQIFWNLLSNAIKFTPEGGQVAIGLSVSHDASGQSCQIRITDTGIGIASDFLPHVFEYFRQAEGGSTRRYGGLGLGLAIVRHLVELHGGTVIAESPGLGQGATFTVKLPLLDNDNRLERMTPRSQTMGVVNASGVETSFSSNAQFSEVKIW
jgi:PAS domain S-box-containing protein